MAVLQNPRARIAAWAIKVAADGSEQSTPTNVEFWLYTDKLRLKVSPEMLGSEYVDVVLTDVQTDLVTLVQLANEP